MASPALLGFKISGGGPVHPSRLEMSDLFFQSNTALTVLEISKSTQLVRRATCRQIQLVPHNFNLPYNFIHKISII